jgi:hypothetical protein
VVDLDPQMITNPRWPAPATTWVNVRAVTNGKEIAVRLSWTDPTRNYASFFGDFNLIGAITYCNDYEKRLHPSKFCNNLTIPNKFIKLGEEIMRETCAFE